MDPDKKMPPYDSNPPPSDPVAPEKICLRCGTCCEKGGPGFHQADRILIDNGVIPARNLFTIRKGESAYDNVKGCLMPVDSDIIKIKGKEDTWTCIFFDDLNKQCSIYHDRPLECRALKCWDTGELEELYARRRLTRKDLISAVEGLWELIVDHQARCDYGEIKQLIGGLNGPHRHRARKKLLEIIQYDAEIRKLVVEKGALDPAQLDFLFGRPLTQTLPGYGIEVRQEGDKLVIMRK
ncbi:MAG: YkgJ family cysteine cluster protein [Desulfobacterales bacterium]